jgi:MFS family permease
MIYPLMPLFLTRVLGAGAVSLGIIEGTADATSSAFKVISGRLSDRWGIRRPLVIAGYSLSGLVRPLVALVQSWPQLLVVRFADRLGKGVRGAPRDAMLASLATPATRGRIYGLQRAMDHTGAILGPIVASIVLYFQPGHYRMVFGLAILPGILATTTTYFVREHPPASAPAGKWTPDAPRRARGLPPGLAPILGVVGVFALGNSSDAFLLLRLGDVGIAPALVPILWTVHHGVKAATSIWGGVLSDRVGRRGLIAAGWLWYAAVYTGLAFVESQGAVVALFLLYGVYFGLTEGVERALVADLVPEPERGTAFGLYHGLLGVASLAASVVFGVVWSTLGSQWAFGMGAALAIAATLLLGLISRR